MLPTTIDAIKAILKADPSVTPGDRIAITSIIRNHGRTKPAVVIPTENRILRRGEVAARLGCGLRCVDHWAKTGILHKVILPGRIRGCGYRLSEIDALIQEKQTE